MGGRCGSCWSTTTRSCAAASALLEAADDIVVCGEAASAHEAVAVADRALPDVVVMDVKLQDGSGIEATREIRAARPQTRC
jgi:DNA-binding NarL/FixJ family response regulator